jgi:hypothetical protein
VLRMALLASASAFLLGGLLAPGVDAAPAHAATDVVLLVDGSGSISDSDWKLERSGYTSALRDPANVPLDGSIAIGVVQWSTDQRVEVPLTTISDKADLDRVVAGINAMQQMADETAAGDGIFAGTAELQDHKRPQAKPVLCLSTDGTTNKGSTVAYAASEAVTAGVQRFSVIGIEDPPNAYEADLRQHYGPHVFGGGTVTVARETSEFATLIGGSCFGAPVRLRAMEVTQGVQDWKSSLALVGGRETVVRAFVEMPDGSPPTRVTGRLVGTRNGSPLPGSPLAAINPGAAVLARQDIVARRKTLTDSLNFVLPSSWTSGAVTLKFESGGNPVDCKEPGGGGSEADDCLATPSFGTPIDVGVSYFKVQIGNAEPSDAVMAEQIARTRSALPISHLTTASRTITYGSMPVQDHVLTDLLKMYQVERTSCTGACVSSARDRYYGVLDTSGGQGGVANSAPGQVAVGEVAGVPGRNDIDWARNRVAHELAHTFGLHHAVDDSKGIHDGSKEGQCGEFAPSDAPGHDPFVDVNGRRRPGLGPLTSGDEAQVWGMDPRFVNGDVKGLGVIDPHSTWALMSYCDDGTGQKRWISAFEWNAVLNGLRSNLSSLTGEHAKRAAVGAGPAPVEPPAGSKGLLVSGTISSVTGQADIQPVVSLPYPGDAAPGEGPFMLRLLRDDGSTIAERRFVPKVSTGDAPGGVGDEHDDEVGTFSEVMAISGDERVAKVTVTHDTDGELGSRDAPAGDGPQVSGLQVSDTSIGSDPVDLDWDGTAGSTYSVFFSGDDGASWTPLAFDVSHSDHQIATGMLRQTGAGRFAVAVSDGVNGSVAQLGGVTVANAAPTVTIVSPSLGDTSPSGVQLVRFEAIAADRDEVLPDNAITWTSDRHGTLGTGSVFETTAADLSEGKHVITATVRDSQGAETSASIELDINRVAPVPASADLRVAAASAPIAGNGDATLDVTVAGSGPDTAPDLQLTITPAAGLQAKVPTTLDAWTCQVEGRGLRCTRLALPANADTALHVPVATSATGARPSGDVTVEVESGVADPRLDDNRATATIGADPPGGGGSTPGGSGGGSSSSGGSGGGSQGPTKAVGGTSAKLAKATVAKRLRADVKAFRGLVTALRKRGKVAVKVTFLGAGTHRLQLTTTGRQPIVVATGTVAAKKAGTVKLTLKVTKAGRRLLHRHGRPPKFQVADRFTAPGLDVQITAALPKGD